MITNNQRNILRQANITFACFKMVVSALLTPNDISEDSWIEHYNDFAEEFEIYQITIEEFAEEYYQDWNLKETNCELRSKFWKKQREQDKPEFNVSVLLETEGDEGFILGMWDISEKWTELPSYEDPLYKVTGWYHLPKLEK